MRYELGEIVFVSILIVIVLIFTIFVLITGGC